MIFFLIKKQGSLLKQARAISLGHTPFAPLPVVLQLPGPGNFLSSQKKLLHPPVSTKKTITRPDHLCKQCNSHDTVLLKEFIVMKFPKSVNSCYFYHFFPDIGKDLAVLHLNLHLWAEFRHGAHVFYCH